MTSSIRTKILKKLYLLLPDLWVPSLSAVDFGELESRGIRGLLLDLDNTIVAWRAYDVPHAVKEWLAEAKKRGLKLCITSNTRSRKRLERLASELNLQFVRGVIKPRRGGFIRAMEEIGTEPANTAVIGDQVFTDVLGGNRIGLLTILVRPIDKKEFIGTKISRLMEKAVFRWLQRHRCSGTIHSSITSESKDNI